MKLSMHVLLSSNSIYYIMKVSTPPSNELGLFETVTNDTDQHEVSNDNTQLLQDLPVST